MSGMAEQYTMGIRLRMPKIAKTPGLLSRRYIGAMVQKVIKRNPAFGECAHTF